MSSEPEARSQASELHPHGAACPLGHPCCPLVPHLSSVVCLLAISVAAATSQVRVWPPGRVWGAVLCDSGHLSSHLAPASSSHVALNYSPQTPGYGWHLPISKGLLRHTLVNRDREGVGGGSVSQGLWFQLLPEHDPPSHQKKPLSNSHPEIKMVNKQAMAAFLREPEIASRAPSAACGRSLCSVSGARSCW